MKNVDQWIRFIKAKDMTSNELASYILQDLIGYRINSRYRVEDTETLRNAIKAIQQITIQK